MSACRSSASLAPVLPGYFFRASKQIEPNVATPRYDFMAELSPDQKRSDLLFGSTVLGVLLFAAVSGVLFWLVILPS